MYTCFWFHKAHLAPWRPKRNSVLAQYQHKGQRSFQYSHHFKDSLLVTAVQCQLVLYHWHHQHHRQSRQRLVMSGMFMYRRPGFNCVVKQLRFWLFKVDCEFKDCDLRVLLIGHTCVIYTLRSNNCELREKSQFAIFKLRN